MKKGLTILMVMLILGASVTVISAGNYSIYSTFIANGTGDFDRSLDVQTGPGYSGKSLNEDYYTKWMGLGPTSKWDYKSGLQVSMGDNGADMRGTTIDYAQTSFSTNADWSLKATNYDTGALQRVSSRGNMMESLELAIDDRVSVLNFEGAIIGRMKLTEKAVDPLSRLTYLDSNTLLYGQFNVLFESAIVDLSSPLKEEDWLGCP